MRKSHIFLMIAAWCGLATYIALNEDSEETGEDQATGLNQKIQAQEERIEELEAKIVEIEKLLAAKQQAPLPKPRTKANTERIREERIEELEAKIVEIEKLLAAKQQAPPKPRTKASTTLQEHLNATQELHVAEDIAEPHVSHPTQEHLQTIRRLHEVQHKTNKRHLHPPIHIH